LSGCPGETVSAVTYIDN